MEKKLNLGCGEDKKQGYVNLDWSPRYSPDIVHDLNALPYPFEANTFDLVEASHVIEHLDRPFAVMNELHRILKPGGRARIKVPHFSRGFTHAEHAHGFDVTFPTYFNPAYKTSGFYGSEFGLEKMELHWAAFYHLMPYMGYGPVSIAITRAVSGVLSFLANVSPALCSRIWCFWVGGFEEIEFVFVAKK